MPFTRTNPMVIFSLFISVLYFLSCNKNSTVFLPNSFEKIKTFSVEQVNDSMTYGSKLQLQYNEQGQCIAAFSLPDTAETRYSFSYTDSGKASLEIYHYNEKNIQQDYYLTTNFKIDSTINYTFPGGYPSVANRYIYSDSTGELTQMRQHFFSNTGMQPPIVYTYVYNTDSSIQKIVSYGTTESFEYYTGLSGFIFNPENPFARRSPHLIKTSTLNQNGASATFRYVYAFDNQKRVTKQVMSKEGGGLVVTKVFTYW